MHHFFSLLGEAEASASALPKLVQLQNSSFLNADFLVFDAKFLVFNAKFII